MRKILSALALIASLATAHAAAPPPVPGLPDTQRLTTYTLSASTCDCAVNFALYGDSTDYANWMQVWVNGVQIPQSGNWTIASPTGPLSTIPRPITDAVLTFTQPQTGTVQIVGARRPRRTSTYSENRGVSARDLNQLFNDVIATDRERWDQLSRTLQGQPGEVFPPLPVAANRAGMFLCFDSSSGLPTVCAGSPGSASIAAGTNISLVTAGGVTTINGQNILAGSNISVTPGVGNTTIAALLNYTAPGTGGAQQPIASRLAREIWANDYGAVCDGTTDDAAAFQNAITAAAARSVALRFTGFCKINSPLSITSGLTIRGTGRSNSELIVAPANNGINIVTSGTVELRDFGIQYSSAANSGTYGIFKTTPGSAQSVGDRYENLQIFGANIAMGIDKANIWTLTDSLISAVNYGIWIDNSFNFDNGDMVLSRNTFTAIANSAVTYYGGGGLRLVSNKMSGSFTTGVEMNLGSGGTPTNSTTSDLIAVGNSIESNTASSLGFYFHRTGTVQFFNVVLADNQLLTNTGIYVPTDATGNWITSMSVSGTTWLASGSPGGAMYSIDSVNGLNIVGGSASSGGSVNTIYNFGANVSGKFSPPAITGTVGASVSSAASMLIYDPVGVTFANLPPTAANGSQVFVTNGTTASSPCTGSGTGAIAFRTAGSWRCF